MECRTSILRTLGLFLAAIGMTALGGFPALKGTGLAVVVGWVGLVFFGTACVFAVIQLFRRRPSIIIDAEGLYWVRLGKDRIPWTRVARVSISGIQRQRFLCLWLHDEDAYVDSLALARRTVAKANARLGFPAATVTFQGLSPGLDDAYRYIQTLVPEKIASATKCTPSTSSIRAPCRRYHVMWMRK
jgi:hypothetical protein